MALYILYLLLNHERILVYDNAIHRVVYEGSSDTIPEELMSELVHDITIVHQKATNREYFLIDLN